MVQYDEFNGRFYGQHREWSEIEYARIDDVMRSKHMNNLLGISDQDKPDLQEKIKDASSDIEDIFEGVVPKNRSFAQLCVLMTWLMCAAGLPIAEQTGTDRKLSRMGLMPFLERQVRSRISRMKAKPRPLWL